MIHGGLKFQDTRKEGNKITCKVCKPKLVSAKEYKVEGTEERRSNCLSS